MKMGAVDSFGMQSRLLNTIRSESLTAVECSTALIVTSSALDTQRDAERKWKLHSIRSGICSAKMAVSSGKTAHAVRSSTRFFFGLARAILKK